MGKKVKKANVQNSQIGLHLVCLEKIYAYDVEHVIDVDLDKCGEHRDGVNG